MKLGKRPSITVLLPHSFALDVPSLREATAKIGFVGRVLATFRVKELILYPDKPNNPDVRNARLIKTILDYLVTAPYLRKRIYPLQPSLRYVGILPPLNIPTHPEIDAIKAEGVHYRQALVTASGETSILETGLGRPIKIRRRLPKNAIVTLKVHVGQNRIRYSIVPKKSDEIYTGFKTVVADSLQEVLKRYDFKIATSRLGQPIDKVFNQLADMLARSQKACVAFGAADRGLKEIAEDLGIDYVTAFTMAVNFAPGQAVRTIRTEEALAYTLSILNLITTASAIT